MVKFFSHLLLKMMGDPHSKAAALPPSVLRENECELVTGGPEVQNDPQPDMP